MEGRRGDIVGGNLGEQTEPRVHLAAGSEPPPAASRNKVTSLLLLQLLYGGTLSSSESSDAHLCNQQFWVQNGTIFTIFTIFCNQHATPPQTTANIYLPERQRAEAKGPTAKSRSKPPQTRSCLTTGAQRGGGGGSR